MATKASSPARKPVRRTSVQTHEIRIIGGQWKRTRIKVVDDPALRPTPDRVRETLFNWLGQDLRGMRCVDAFAGTGALGFEAASRGAAEVQLVEHNAALVTQLQKVRTQLLALQLPEPLAQSIVITRGEGLAALRQLAPARWDVIFLDPPFDSDLYAQALQAATRALAATGQIYLESSRAWTDLDLEPLGLVLHRHLKAGAVHAHLLRLRPSAA